MLNCSYTRSETEFCLGTNIQRVPFFFFISGMQSNDNSNYVGNLVPITSRWLVPDTMELNTSRVMTADSGVWLGVVVEVQPEWSISSAPQAQQCAGERV